MTTKLKKSDTPVVTVRKDGWFDIVVSHPRLDEPVHLHVTSTFVSHVCSNDNLGRLEINSAGDGFANSCMFYYGEDYKESLPIAAKYLCKLIKEGSKDG